MDKGIRQLTRLFSLYDGRILRNLSMAVMNTEYRRYRGQQIADYRRNLLKAIKSRGLINEAIEHLVVRNENEFISPSEWRLDELVGASEAVLYHEHFAMARRFIYDNFEPKQASICLFMPCHRVKPYWLSPTIRAVSNALESWRLLERVVIVVASVPGMVPLGFDRYYPVAYYDWDPRSENKRLTVLYSRSIYQNAKEFIKLTKGLFKHYIGYFRSESVEAEALCAAARDESIEIQLTPSRETVNRVKGISKVVWRYGGLKRAECLKDLQKLLSSNIDWRGSYA